MPFQNNDDIYEIKRQNEKQKQVKKKQTKKSIQKKIQ
jgi:hypothetical protein